MTESQNKDKHIMIRVTPELKSEFYKKCEEMTINPSAWLRKQIENFIKSTPK